MLERQGEDERKVTDMKATWENWRAIRENRAFQNLEEREKEITAAQARLWYLRILKAPAYVTSFLSEL